MKEIPRSYDHAPKLPLANEVPIGDVLSGQGPLLLEIGSGRGAFALQYAKAFPTHRVIALEIRKKYAALLAERFVKEQLTNARCFAEDARVALTKLQPNACVDFVAIHFPDPWWKKRHAKRLVVADAVITQLARLMKPNGIVFVQTDVEERAEQYREAFEDLPTYFTCQRVSESPFIPARSNRESRAIQDGLPIYRLAIERTERVFVAQNPQSTTTTINE